MVFRHLVFQWCCLVYDGVETAVFVRRVLHSPDGSVRLHHGVLSLDDVAVARLMLAFDVAGVVVVDAVFEGVFWVCLK